MRRLTTIAMVFALAGLLAGPVAASHSWASYHWQRSSNPLNLDFGDNISADYEPNLAIALADWEGSSVLGSLNEVPGAGLKGCGAVTGRVEVCSDRYGYRNGGWLGMAQVWVSGSHIEKAVVKLNDTFLVDDARYNSEAWQQLVTCQEIGHVLGLDHQDEDFATTTIDAQGNGTCMDYTSDPSLSQHPNAHDYEQLEVIYAHLDGGSGGGGGGGGNCPPKKPGCSGGRVGNAPSFSQASRANGPLYVDSLPGGGMLITHVLWVPQR